MKKESKIPVSEIKAALAEYTGRGSVLTNDDYKVLWHGFRKYCRRNKGVISRSTLAEIEKRGWFLPSQAEKFCKYAGIKCPK